MSNEEKLKELLFLSKLISLLLVFWSGYIQSNDAEQFFFIFSLFMNEVSSTRNA